MINLSGLWEGAYHYRLGGQSVGFDAQLDHNGESFSGIITENNTFDEEAGSLLSAAIAGQVEGNKVSFKKTYVGEGRAQHSVQYNGILSKDKKYIEGQWKIGWMSGEFEMFRLSGGQEALHKVAEELTI